MSLYEKLINREEKLALVGLGYVGMPIAVAFAKKGLDVIQPFLCSSKSGPTTPLGARGIPPQTEYR